MWKVLAFLLLVAIMAMGNGCDYGTADNVTEEAVNGTNDVGNVGNDNLAVVEGSLIVEAFLPSSGSKTVNISVYPDANNMLIMRSPKAGTWSFKTWGSPIMGGCGDTAVFTSWKNESQSNNTWNYWPGGGQVCWPTSFFTTKLYSGSKDIMYQFNYQQYGNYGQTVYAKFTKL